MELLRKLKKKASLHIGQDHTPPPPPPPLPRGRHEMRMESPRPMVDYGPLPRSFFHAVNSARQDAGYDALPVFPHGSIPNGDENGSYEQVENDFPSFHRSRSKSRDRAVDRGVRPRSRGTPVKFRRRPISPDLLQPRPSPAFHFRQHSLPNSPHMHHRFQHLPPQQLFDMNMAHPVQFYPQFQQPFYPMMHPHVPPWFMMRQPQMYPLY